MHGTSAKQVHELKCEGNTHGAFCQCAHFEGCAASRSQLAGNFDACKQGAYSCNTADDGHTCSTNDDGPDNAQCQHVLRLQDLLNLRCQILERVNA